MIDRTTSCTFAKRTDALAPLPQLFPNLNKSLHLARARETVINEAAILICPVVKLPHGWQAEVREIVTEFLEVFLAQHLRFALVGASGHAGEFCTFRLVFANIGEAEPRNAFPVLFHISSGIEGDARFGKV